MANSDQNDSQTPESVSVPRPQRCAIRKTALHVSSRCWRHAVVLATPVLLLFLPFSWTEPRKAGWGAYAIAIIVVYWVTEALPLAVTALLPLVLFPAVGVLSAQDTATSYLNDTNMLFFSSLIVAVAIEKWNVHKRIALLVLLLVGSKPKWLMLGFMSTTGFLSMWMSNIATTAMMLPIAKSILLEIEAQSLKHHHATNVEGSVQNVDMNYVRMTNTASGADTSSDGEGEHTIDTNKSEASTDDGTKQQASPVQKQSRKCCVKIPANATPDDRLSHPPSTAQVTAAFRRLSKGLYLSIAYSANIGSTATLTGSGSIRILAGDLLSLFPSSPGISFGRWVAFAAPTMAVCLATAWIYLSTLYCDDSLAWCKRKLFKRVGNTFSHQTARSVIKQQYKALGSWRFAEVAVLCCFIILALLWLLREPNFIPGWGIIFPTDEHGRSYFTDASIAFVIVFVMFLIPSKSVCTLFQKETGCCDKQDSFLLDWDSVQQNLPWGVLFLQGSGFAIAKGAEVSGLSCWLSTQLLGLNALPQPLIALSVTAMVAIVTEFVSNSATSTIILPVLANLAVSLAINPLYLMITAAVAASYAFMLPVATPPNALTFTYGNLKIYDMALTGILMNVACVLILNLSINTLAVPVFDLHTFPNWSNSSDFSKRACFSNVTGT